MKSGDPVRFAAHLGTRLGTGALAPPDIAARVTAALGATGVTAVLAPPDAAAVAGALALCSAETWPVIAAGSGSWLGRRGQVPDRPPVVISTVRLNRVTEHEPADLVIGVQAGMPLVGLAGRLAEKRQWLPLDPPAAADATIGAVAARADAGPLRAGHGTPRDMVLGLELATGDGRLLRFGGRVVKNVAGYDGVRLGVGSRGALGIITALYVRVRGAPRADRTLALECGADDDGARRGAGLALAIRDIVQCDALELISPAVAAALGAAPEWTVLVRMMGGPAAVGDGVDRVSRLADRDPAATAVAELPAGVWDALARLEAEAAVALRLTGTATTLETGLAAAAALTAAPGWMVGAHAADGVIRLWRTVPGGVEVPDEALRDLVADAGTRGWTARYDMLSAGLETPASDRSADVIVLTRRLRSVFDRAGIMQAEAVQS